MGQLKISLRSVLDQWTLYKAASEEINGFLMEGRYSVSRFRLLTGSLEAVQLQVDSLQVWWPSRLNRIKVSFVSPFLQAMSQRASHITTPKLT